MFINENHKAAQEFDRTWIGAGADNSEKIRPHRGRTGRNVFGGWVCGDFLFPTHAEAEAHGEWVDAERTKAYEALLRRHA